MMNIIPSQEPRVKLRISAWSCAIGPWSLLKSFNKDLKSFPTKSHLR